MDADEMTLLDRAFEAVRGLPQAPQDELARFLLELAATSPRSLSAEEAEAIAKAEAEIARGERVPAGTLDAFWRSNGV